MWWQTTGEVIDTETFIIHHTNEDKHDNRFQNLEKMLRAEHSREHSMIAETRIIVCDWCGIKFERTLRNIKSHIRAGAKHSFCCRSHQVRFQQKYQR